ncbi:MAG: hypothetical protein WCF65_06910 [Parachlamydiaceae bacterium]
MSVVSRDHSGNQRESIPVDIRSEGGFRETILENETERLLISSVQHIAVPLILGLSMDFVSPREWALISGGQPKPAPMNAEIKLNMYKRILGFYRPIISERIKDIVRLSLSKTPFNISDINFKTETDRIADLLKRSQSPDWSKEHFVQMINDCAILFKEFASSSPIRINPTAVHEAICPIMSSYRDSGELMARTRLNELY